MLLIAPVAVILVAENLGHIKAVSAMTVATSIASWGAPSSAMAWRRWSRVAPAHRRDDLCREHRRDGRHQDLLDGDVRRRRADRHRARLFAEVRRVDPGHPVGGDGRRVDRRVRPDHRGRAKIWVDNRVDFSDNANLIVVAITLVLGTGDFTLKFGGFALGGIGTATFGAILLYALLGRRR